jgi:hypothetical protein
METHSEPISKLVEALSASSRRNYHNIYDYIQWPASVDPDADWCTAPELVSLYGTPLWERLGERARKRLAFWEAVNFYSLNIRGETALMQGLAARLYRAEHGDLAPYLHHFLDEENKHCVLFGTFCSRYGGKVYDDRKLWEEARSYEEGEEDFLFFAKVLIFEEVVDRFNLAMSKDERLHPVALAINLNHHLEEARHLAFGRRVVQELWARHAPGWSAETRAAVPRYLELFMRTSWREYYNPDMYADARVAEELGDSERTPWDLQQDAWESPTAVALRSEMTGKCVSFFRKTGIWTEVVVP